MKFQKYFIHSECVYFERIRFWRGGLLFNYMCNCMKLSDTNWSGLAKEREKAEEEKKKAIANLSLLTLFFFFFSLFLHLPLFLAQRLRQPSQPHLNTSTTLCLLPPSFSLSSNQTPSSSPKNPFSGLALFLGAPEEILMYQNVTNIHTLELVARLQPCVVLRREAKSSASSLHLTKETDKGLLKIPGLFGGMFRVPFRRRWWLDSRTWV